MNSSEVGWFSRSMTTLKLPSRLTLTRAPVFGSAGEPSGFPSGNTPWGEGVQPMPGAELHIHRQAAASGHLPDGGRLGPERHRLAVLGQVGDGAGLGHVA